MAHTCELRGYLCYCDLEDCESEGRPDDCTHFSSKHRNYRKAQMSAGRSEGKMLDGETRSKTTDRVECPYCGHENNLNDLYSDLRGPEAATAQCSDCENQFRAIFIVSISVRAVRLEK